MGYHKTEIQKGVLGKFSKIREEFEEFLDSIDQRNYIMSFIELSDMIGAIEWFSEDEFYQMTHQESFVDSYDLNYLTELNLKNSITNLKKWFYWLETNYHQCNIEQTQKIIDQHRSIMDDYMKNFNLSIDHLETMNSATQNAFESGSRT